MLLSPINARRWRRYRVNLPVRIIVRIGAECVSLSGRGTDLGRGGMMLHAEVSLEPGDRIEVDFQTPSQLQVAGTIRNQLGHRFGVEFVTPLQS